MVSMTGLPDMPIKAGISVADSGSGVTCALAIIAALYQRQTQGIGQRVDVAMQEVIIGLSRSSWEPYYKTGKSPKRVGNGMPLEDVAPAETYPCKPFGPNDYVHIYCSRAPGSSDFKKLCKVIGREDLLEDPRMATPQSRYLHKEVLDGIISEWTKQHTKIEAMDIVAKADIPAGAVLDIDDITKDPHYVNEGIIVEVEHRQLGKLKVPGLAPRLSENHVEYQPSPELGGSNREVYQGVLGLTDSELEALQAKKVI
jgi:formyl-CoA transferase